MRGLDAWTAVFTHLPGRPLSRTGDKRNGADQRQLSPWAMFQLETQRSLRILNLNQLFRLLERFVSYQYDNMWATIYTSLLELQGRINVVQGRSWAENYIPRPGIRRARVGDVRVRQPGKWTAYTLSARNGTEQRPISMFTQGPLFPWVSPSPRLKMAGTCKQARS